MVLKTSISKIVISPGPTYTNGTSHAAIEGRIIQVGQMETSFRSKSESGLATSRRNRKTFRSPSVGFSNSSISSGCILAMFYFIQHLPLRAFFSIKVNEMTKCMVIDLIFSLIQSQFRNNVPSHVPSHEPV